MVTEEYMRAAIQERLSEAAEIHRQNEARALMEKDATRHERFSVLRSLRIPLRSVPLHWHTNLGGAPKKA
jgi:hypothetical protein